MSEMADVIAPAGLGGIRSTPLTALYPGTGTSAEKVVRPDDEITALLHNIFLRDDALPAQRTVVFTGVEHGVGASRIAAQTASLLSQHAGPVCLFEANLRSPSLADAFGVTSRAGLTSVLEKDMSILDAATPVEENRLWLVAAGSRKAVSSSLLTTAFMRDKLEELKSRFQTIIIDAPPLTYYETQMITQAADGAVLVLEAGRTHRKTAAAAVEEVRLTGTSLLAAVLNKRSLPIPAGLYKRL